MTVKYNEYNKDRENFFKKHKYDYECNTSSMNEYGVYHKEYMFSDGAVWFERMSPEYEKVEVTVDVKGVTIETELEVKLFCTEFWNTDTGVSKKYYERF